MAKNEFPSRKKVEEKTGQQPARPEYASLSSCNYK